MQTTYSTKKAAALAQRLAEQEAENARRLAAIQAEQEAHEAKLAKALAEAGPARVAFVEDLLDRLDIGPEPMAEQRHKRTGEVVTDRAGQPRMVDPDPHEEVRMARLAEALDVLLEGSADDGAGVADEPAEVEEQDVLDEDDDTAAQVSDDRAESIEAQGANAWSVA